MNRRFEEDDDGVGRFPGLENSMADLRGSIDSIEAPEFRRPKPIGTIAAVMLVIGGLWAGLTSFDRDNDATIIETAAEAEPASQDEAEREREQDESPDGSNSAGSNSAGSNSAGSNDDGSNSDGSDPKNDDVVADEVVEGVGDDLEVTIGADGVMDLGFGSGEALVPINDTISMWNADESAVMLYRVGGEHIVASTETGELINRFDLPYLDIETVFWDPIDASTFHVLGKSSVFTYNSASNDPVSEIKIDNCDEIDDPPGLGAILNSDRLMGVVCQGPTGRRHVVVDLDSGSVVAERAATEAEGSPTPSLTGQYVLVRDSDAERVTVYDSTLTSAVSDFSWNAYTEFTIDGDGREVLVDVSYIDDQPGSVVLADLATGKRRAVIGPSTGDAYPMDGSELSATGTGLVLLGAGVAGDTSYEGQLEPGTLYLVDINESPPVPVAVASHDSSMEGDLDYWAEWHVSISPSGRFAAFATDRNGSGEVVTRIVDIDQ